MGWYCNLFQPVLHLQESRLRGTGRPGSFDRAQTPFERLCATGVSPQSGGSTWKLCNPRRLRQEIYALVDYDLPGAVPGQPEDIFQTLKEVALP